MSLKTLEQCGDCNHQMLPAPTISAGCIRCREVMLFLNEALPQHDNVRIGGEYPESIRLKGVGCFFRPTRFAPRT